MQTAVNPDSWTHAHVLIEVLSPKIKHWFSFPFPLLWIVGVLYYSDGGVGKTALAVQVSGLTIAHGPLRLADSGM